MGVATLESLATIAAQTKAHISGNVAIHARTYAANASRTSKKLEPQPRKAYKENTAFTIIGPAI